MKSSMQKTYKILTMDNHFESIEPSNLSIGYAKGGS
jgi:hypothetical protein